jgi:hypothetical protein
MLNYAAYKLNSMVSLNRRIRENLRTVTQRRKGNTLKQKDKNFCVLAPLRWEMAFCETIN